MEPPPFGDGNSSKTHADDGSASSLQWSHRPSAMETGLVDHAAAAVAVPSMEPPPFGDGNQIAPAVAGRKKSLQWSHRPSAMETWATSWGASTRRSFNGATALRRWKLLKTTRFPRSSWTLQWSHRPSAMETPWGCRRRGCYGTFNGATALRRWKRYYILNGATAFQPFNGATALRRWKPANASVC